MRLGYIFLLMIYTSSFAIGITLSKDVFYHNDSPSITLRQKCQRKADEVSDFIMDNIGMNNFFEELNKGM